MIFVNSVKSNGRALLTQKVDLRFGLFTEKDIPPVVGLGGRWCNVYITSLLQVVEVLCL